MKWQKIVAVIATPAFLASCGNSSDDKTITTVVDTAVGAPIDTTQQKTDTAKMIVVNVPEKTKTSFQKKYPEATDVKWESHKKDARGVEWDLTDWEDVDEEGSNAWFHWQGNESKAYYNKKGDWVGTTDAVSDPKTLPAAVTSYLNKEFSGYKVSSVTRENDKSRIAYEVTLEKGDEKVKALIDENGVLRKKKTVSGGVKTKEKNME